MIKEKILIQLMTMAVMKILSEFDNNRTIGTIKKSEIQEIIKDMTGDKLTQLMKDGKI